MIHRIIGEYLYYRNVKNTPRLLTGGGETIDKAKEINNRLKYLSGNNNREVIEFAHEFGVPLSKQWMIDKLKDVNKMPDSQQLYMGLADAVDQVITVDLNKVKASYDANINNINRMKVDITEQGSPYDSRELTETIPLLEGMLKDAFHFKIYLEAELTKLKSIMYPQYSPKDFVLLTKAEVDRVAYPLNGPIRRAEYYENQTKIKQNLLALINDLKLKKNPVDRAQVTKWLADNEALYNMCRRYVTNVNELKKYEKLTELTDVVAKIAAMKGRVDTMTTRLLQDYLEKIRKGCSVPDDVYKMLFEGIGFDLKKIQENIQRTTLSYRGRVTTFLAVQEAKQKDNASIKKIYTDTKAKFNRILDNKESERFKKLDELINDLISKKKSNALVYTPLIDMLNPVRSIYCYANEININNVRNYLEKNMGALFSENAELITRQATLQKIIGGVGAADLKAAEVKRDQLLEENRTISADQQFQQLKRGGEMEFITEWEQKRDSLDEKARDIMMKKIDSEIITLTNKISDVDAIIAAGNDPKNKNKSKIDVNNRLDELLKKLNDVHNKIVNFFPSVYGKTLNITNIVDRLKTKTPLQTGGIGTLSEYRDIMDKWNINMTDYITKLSLFSQKTDEVKLALANVNNLINEYNRSAEQLLLHDIYVSIVDLDLDTIFKPNRFQSLDLFTNKIKNKLMGSIGDGGNYRVVTHKRFVNMVNFMATLKHDGRDEALWIDLILSHPEVVTLLHFYEKVL